MTHQFRTVLAGGLQTLGLPMPAGPLKPAKPSRNQSTIIMQKPAKPAKAKIKFEDYSTPYQPPQAPLAKRVAQEPAGIEAFVIEDDVAVPAGRGTGAKIKSMDALLKKLKPGQSVLMGMALYSTLVKARTLLHKAGCGQYVCRSYKDDKTFRAWRVA